MTVEALLLGVGLELLSFLLSCAGLWRLVATTLALVSPLLRLAPPLGLVELLLGVNLAAGDESCRGRWEGFIAAAEVGRRRREMLRLRHAKGKRDAGE